MRKLHGRPSGQIIAECLTASTRALIPGALCLQPKMGILPLSFYDCQSAEACERWIWSHCSRQSLDNIPNASAVELSGQLADPVKWDYGLCCRSCGGLRRIWGLSSLNNLDERPISPRGIGYRRRMAYRTSRRSLLAHLTSSLKVLFYSVYCRTRNSNYVQHQRRIPISTVDCLPLGAQKASNF
jgi:hypothetical protein